MIRRLTILSILVATLLAAIAPPAMAEVKTDSWIKVDVAADSAEPTAEVLGTSLAKQLKSEHSKVVFLNVTECDPGLSDAKNWCASFQSELEKNLIRQGLRFLPETTKGDIRQKIAAEQVYQHNSMQVDVSKAVALGKQKAFQAFVTVTVNGDGQGNIKASARSVNIQEGVVSVSENTGLKVKEENVRPWSGWMLMGGGLAGTAAGLYLADKEKTKSDIDYAKYKQATDADSATAARSKVGQDDQAAALYQDAAMLSAAVGIFGLCYYMTNSEQTISYKLNLVSTSDSNHSGQGWHLEPILSNNLLGLSVKTNW